MATLAAEPETALLTFTVRNARPVSSKTLFALVDVDLKLGGVSLQIQGVQARRLAGGGTSVHLPTCKDPDVDLPWFGDPPRMREYRCGP